MAKIELEPTIFLNQETIIKFKLKDKGAKLILDLPVKIDSVKIKIAVEEINALALIDALLDPELHEYILYQILSKVFKCHE